MTFGCIVLSCFVALGYLCYVLVVWQKRRLIKALTGEDDKNNLWKGGSTLRSMFTFALTSLAFGLLFVVLSQPKWGLIKQEVVMEGRNVVFALDLSRSMLAKDLLPNRLELAKLKMKDIFNKLGPERFGLIFFSDRAYLHCPFTTDKFAFFSFLDQADSCATSGGGTSLAKALDEAVYTFQSVFPHLKKRIVVLVTDCEDFSEDIARSITEAKKANINVIILVTATEMGAPIPIVDSYGREIGHETDSSGAVIMTKLNNDLVKTLSEDLGAKVVKISNGSSDTESIVNFVNKFEKEKFDNKNINIYKEQQYIFSAAFFVLWTLLWFL